MKVGDKVRINRGEWVGQTGIVEAYGEYEIKVDIGGKSLWFFYYELDPVTEPVGPAFNIKMSVHLNYDELTTEQLTGLIAAASVALAKRGRL